MGTGDTGAHDSRRRRRPAADVRTQLERFASVDGHATLNRWLSPSPATVSTAALGLPSTKNVIVAGNTLAGSTTEPATSTRPGNTRRDSRLTSGGAERDTATDGWRVRGSSARSMRNIPAEAASTVDPDHHVCRAIEEREERVERRRGFALAK